MVGVGGVTAVAEYHPAGVDRFVVKDPLCSQALPAAGVGVDGDGSTCSAMRLGHRTHDPFHPCGHSLLVNGALEHAGLHPGAGDPFGDVAHEHVDHRIGDRLTQGGLQCRAAVMEEERHVAIGVTTGGHHNVEIGHLGGDALNAGDVAAEPDDCRVDDGAHPPTGQLVELLDGVVHPGVFVAPFVGIVLLHVGSEHKDVLVHVGATECGAIDGTSDGLNLGHDAPRCLLSVAVENRLSPVVTLPSPPGLCHRTVGERLVRRARSDLRPGRASNNRCRAYERLAASQSTATERAAHNALMVAG